MTGSKELGWDSIWFSDRIVGMRYGRIIFDDKPAALTRAEMDQIYAGVPAQDRAEAGAAA